MLFALLGGFVVIALLTMDSLRGFVPGSGIYLVNNTLFSAMLGGAVALGFYYIDYRRFVRVAPWLFGLTLLLLTIPWVSSGTLTAASPYLLVIASGAVLSKHKLNTQAGLYIAVAIVIIPTLLLASQPSLTAAAVYLVASFAMLMSTSVDKKRVAIAAIALILVLTVVITAVRPYAWTRLSVFLNPQDDPSDAGYLHIALMEAIEQGGVFGQRGLATAGTIPEPHTDFVFTYLTYRYGWIAGMALIFLAGLFILRLIHTCRAIREPLGRTVAIGIASILAMHFTGNILVSIGKAPIVAVPFPFISYSRIQLVAEIASIGLVLGIYRIKDMINHTPNTVIHE